MKNLYNLIILSFVLFILTTGCDSKKEVVPAYLHIIKFTLTTNPLTEGLNTQEISDAKVFANGKEIGSFELPITIPISVKGNKVEILVLANIKENGSSSKRVNYSPYLYFIDTLNLAENEIDSIRPKIRYRSNANFAWLEDFEDQANSLQKSGSSNTNDSLLIIPTSNNGVDQPFSGSKYCGLIDIAASDKEVIFERNTLNQYTVPNKGADVYLEMDIKTNVNLQVGIYTDDGTTIQEIPIYVIFDTETKWKKAYINLNSETGTLSSNSKIRLFFGIYKSGSDITTAPKVYLDNLKLIYLN